MALECVMCGAVYDRPRKSKRRTCSRSCAVALSWLAPGVAEARARINSISHSTPEAIERTRKVNLERWSDPKERERLSQLNEQRWGDPTYKAEVSAQIRAAWTPEIRGKASKQKQEYWKCRKQKATGRSI